MRNDATTRFDSSTPPAARRRPGTVAFTLVESIIAATICLIIFTVGFMVISGTIRVRGETMARVHATENARFFLQQIERELNCAYPYLTTNTPKEQKRQIVSDTFQVDDTYYHVNSKNYNKIDQNSIQFYTNADLNTLAPDANDPESKSPMPPDRYVFVRYYVNPLQHTLCRYMEDIRDLSKVPDAMNYSDPRDWSQIADVRQMTATFKRWVPSDKHWEPLDPTRPIDPADATHIEVRIVMFDQETDNRGRSNTSNTTEIYSAYRAFTKLIELPAAFSRQQ